MKEKNQYTLTKKIHYLLDDFISKGFFAQIILLAGVAVAIIVIFGIILVLFGDEASVSDGIWESLMHMIDQGTITGDDTESDSFLRIMLVLTFIGMAFTSTIIGIINSSIQEKMYELRKGHSGIIEKDHGVIMGFNENTYTIAREIIEGGKRRKVRDCLVVVDDLPKEDMEHDVKEFQQSRQEFFEKDNSEKRRKQRFKFIFRSGDLISENTFRMCAMDRARSIIVNRQNDLETVRILMALVSFLKKNKAYISDESMPSLVALIHNGENLDAAKSAAGVLHEKGHKEKQKNEYKVRILYYREILISLFSQACIQPGLPFVLDSLFNSYAASICMEKEAPEKEERQESRFFGKNLQEISEMVSDAIPLGFAGKDEYGQIHVRLAPGKDVRYGKGDRLVYLSNSDFLRTEGRVEAVPAGTPSENADTTKPFRHFLLIGWTGNLPGLVGKISNRVAPGSSADIIADETESRIETGTFQMNCRVHDCPDPYRFCNTRKILDEHPEWFDMNHPDHITNIVILSDSSVSKNNADEKVTVFLLNLRNYLQERQCSVISITSEMYLPKNQALMQANSGNDFVVASEIANRMMVQIAEDPRKYYVIDDLLKQKTGVVSLREVSRYIDIASPFNFEGVFREVTSRGEAAGKPVIPLGWIRFPDPLEEGDSEQTNLPLLVLNPTAEEREKIVEDCVKDGVERYRLIFLTESSG